MKRFFNFLLFVTLLVGTMKKSKATEAAWLQSPRFISIHMVKNFNTDKKVAIVDSDGKTVELDNIYWDQNSKELKITLKDNFNFNQNFYLKTDDLKFPIYFSRNVLDQYFYLETKLGASWSGEKGQEVKLTLWSPPATKVSLLLWQKEKLIETILLDRADKGLWQTTISARSLKLRSLEGFSYQYQVTAFNETNTVLDPYAIAMDAFDPASAEKVGRGVLVDERFLKKVTPIFPSKNLSDVVAYEAHVRDFTIHPSSGVEKKLAGTYLGITKKIPYLKKLGITHLQLLPIYNHYRVNELSRQFQDGNTPKTKLNYNWGYDPHQFFTPEGHYSEAPGNPLSRLQEVQEMVQNLKEENIGVVMDVVYNHVYKHEAWEQLAPGCYLRRDDRGNISYKSGAGATFETRNKMARKLMIDSLLHWQNFYGMGGFRFDLMGFIDQDSMREIRSKLNPQTVINGEAWEFTDLPDSEALIKSRFNLREIQDLKISAFNDTARDSITGHQAGLGLVQGANREKAKYLSAVVGGVANFPSDKNVEMSRDQYHLFTAAPWQSLNYLTIHDGFTLNDKLNLSTGAKIPERINLMKQAYAVLLTTQGRIAMQAGDELGRCKPLQKNDPEPSRAHTSKVAQMDCGVKFFHENTYASSDATNAIDWGRQDFAGLSEFVSLMIHFRREHPGFYFEKSDSVVRGINFYHEENNNPKMILPNYFNSFSDPRLTQLKIRFVNAPVNLRNQTWYVVGEVHPSGVDKNPKLNSFKVELDEKGSGEIVYAQKDCQLFDLKEWSDPSALQFKLVSTPGQWDFPRESYSEFGNNTIHPSSINPDGSVIIDLSIEDHRAGAIRETYSPHVAYMIQNDLESSAEKIKKILVLHNFSNDEWKFPLKSFAEGKWTTQMDNLNFETKAVEGDFYVVKPHASSILEL